MANEFGSRNEALVNLMDSSGARASEAILAHGEGVIARLTQTSEAVANEFGSRNEALVNLMDSSGARASDAILAHGEGVIARLTQTSEAIGERVRIAQRGARQPDGFQRRARFRCDSRAWRRRHCAARAGQRCGGE